MMQTTRHGAGKYFATSRDLRYCAHMANTGEGLDLLRAQVAALTARVYRLEQELSGAAAGDSPVVRADHDEATHIDDAPAAVPLALPQLEGTMLTPPLPRDPSATAIHSPLRPSPPRPPLPGAKPFAPRSPGDADLEKKIGQYWLNRIGIIAMLVGVSYFLRFAFENNWIGPSGRVAIGLLAGAGLILWSEGFRKQGHPAFSYSLKAVGIGTLYLSLWAAFQVYRLIPSSAAFLAMIVVTGATIAMAISQDAEILAVFAIAGGFATPVLLSTHQNHEVILFSYVLLLDLAILVTSIAKPWRRLLWGSAIGTVTLYCGWAGDYYSVDQRGTTVFFLLAFGALFAIVPLVNKMEKSTRFGGVSATLTLIPLINAFLVFLALYFMYSPDNLTLTLFALAFAAIYLGISAAFKWRFPDEETTALRLLHVVIAVAFITIAIPLKLDGHWITIGWLMESAVLLWFSVKTETNFIRWMAATALTLGIVRLLFFDWYRTDTLVFNARFGTYLVAIAVLAGIAIYGQQYASEREMPFVYAAIVGANLLALIALTLEANDYFNRQIVELGGFRNYANFHQMSLERSFSFSAIWLLYGAALMAVGFWRRSSFVRWQALILMALTIGKVFIVDVSQLGGGFRILSFIALGVVLLGVSFIYQRDWLKLNARE
jgi:uncharacterized membrane protein